MTPYYRGQGCEFPKVFYAERVREAEADYWPIVDVLGEYPGWQLEDDDRGNAVAIATCLQALARQGDLATDRAEEMAPILAHALSAEFGDERDDRCPARYSDISLHNHAAESSQSLTHPLLSLEDLLLG